MMETPFKGGDAMDDTKRGIESRASRRFAAFRVLVVDEDEKARGAWRALLSREGATVVEADSEEQAHQAALRIQPALITLAPRPDGRVGVRCFRDLRRNPFLEDIPVCVVTDQPETRRRLCDQGVRPPDGVVGTLVDAEMTLETLRGVLSRHPRRWSRRTAVRT